MGIPRMLPKLAPVLAPPNSLHPRSPSVPVGTINGSNASEQGDLRSSLAQKDAQIGQLENRLISTQRKLTQHKRRIQEMKAELRGRESARAASDRKELDSLTEAMQRQATELAHVTEQNAEQARKIEVN
jgi:septal ring factor EnvC (AmiA/AmiB activator)